MVGIWTGTFASVEVRAYEAALMGALALVVCGGSAAAWQSGLSLRRSFVCLTLITVASIAGARVGYWLLHDPGWDVRLLFANPAELSRFSLYGGIVASTLAAYVTCRLFSMNQWRLADAISPILAAAIALAKFGCYLNGCCFGRPTDLPWGVSFPPGSQAHLHYAAGSAGLLLTECPNLHPTQLYEIGAAVLAIAIALGVRRAKRMEGMAFLCAATWLAMSQWIIHFCREPYGMSPWGTLIHASFPLVFALIGTGAIIWRANATLKVLDGAAKEFDGDAGSPEPSAGDG